MRKLPTMKLTFKHALAVTTLVLSFAGLRPQAHQRMLMLRLGDETTRPSCGLFVLWPNRRSYFAMALNVG